MPSTVWSEISDAALLSALGTGEVSAVEELHRRYAPLLYALAGRTRPGPPEPEVQALILHLIRCAHHHAHSDLDARLWILGVAQRSWTRR